MRHFLLLFLLLASARSAGVTFRQLAVNSTNFESAGQLSGQVWVGDLSDIRQIFYFGNDVTLTHGYNVTDLLAPVTLTFAVAFRDVTQKPTASLSEVYMTVQQGTCMHSLSTFIAQAPKLGGAASASVNGTFPIGSHDSYGNTIATGDMMAFDWGIFFNAPASNQNATIDIYGQTQSFVLF